MNKEETICKNCKYHYIEEISFDYPQSCCSKRMATTEGWCKCNDFEYSDRYIKQLQQENQKYKEVIEKIKARYINYYGTTKEVNDNYVLRNVLKEISDLLKEVE